MRELPEDREWQPRGCALGAAGIEVAGGERGPDARVDARDQSQADGGGIQGGGDCGGGPAKRAGGECVPEDAGGAAGEVGFDSADDRAAAVVGDDCVAVFAIEF